MTTQSNRSIQITPSLSFVEDYDQTMTKREEFESAFREALGNIEVIKVGRKNVYKYSHNNHDTHFLTGAITWLNNPHPLSKKRFQIKEWFMQYYDDNHDENVDVRIVGVYRYEGMHLFVEFNAEDYKDNNTNSSSAHVDVQDLYSAAKNGYFTKNDENDNTIIIITSENFKEYIDGHL